MGIPFPATFLDREYSYPNLLYIPRVSVFLPTKQRVMPNRVTTDLSDLEGRTIYIRFVGHQPDEHAHWRIDTSTEDIRLWKDAHGRGAAGRFELEVPNLEPSQRIVRIKNTQAVPGKELYLRVRDDPNVYTWSGHGGGAQGRFVFELVRSDIPHLVYIKRVAGTELLTPTDRYVYVTSDWKLRTREEVPGTSGFFEVWDGATRLPINFETGEPYEPPELEVPEVPIDLTKNPYYIQFGSGNSYLAIDENGTIQRQTTPDSKARFQFEYVRSDSVRIKRLSYGNVDHAYLRLSGRNRLYANTSGGGSPGRFSIEVIDGGSDEPRIRIRHVGYRHTSYGTEVEPFLQLTPTWSWIRWTENTDTGLYAWRYGHGGGEAGRFRLVPAPDPTPEPSETPSEIPSEIPVPSSENGGLPTWAIISIIAAVVTLLVALVAFL